MTDPITAAHNAKQALEVLDPAFEAVKQAVLSRMLATSPGDPGTVLALHGAAQAIDAARKAVVDVISNGAMAEHALEAALNPTD